MMYLLTSECEWVDHWGSYFNLPRFSGEPDELYKQRILWEITRPKQTIQGIKELIIRYTGLSENEIIIFEPFTQLKPTDFGAETDITRVYGWEYWTWAVIDIHIPLQFSFELSRKIQETTKAYGIKIVFTTHTGGIYDASDISTLLVSCDSSSVVNAIQIKYGYTTDYKGLTDGGLPFQSEFSTQYERIITFTLSSYENYGYGTGGYGSIPYGGTSFVYETLVFDEDPE